MNYRDETNSITDDFSLNVIEIESPCTADWNSMTGSEQIRHCSLCDSNVYNLSEMTEKEAKACIKANEGRICVRLFRRKDGTVVTRDCSLLTVVSRWGRAGLFASVSLLLLMVTGGAFAMAVSHDWTKHPLPNRGPLAGLYEWIHPTQVFMGGMSAPPATPNVPTNGS